MGALVCAVHGGPGVDHHLVSRPEVGSQMTWEHVVIVWLLISCPLTYALGNEGRNKRKDFWITAFATIPVAIPCTLFLMREFGIRGWRQ